MVPNHSPEGRMQGSYLSLLHVNNAILHLSKSKCLNRQRGKRNSFPSGSVRRAVIWHNAPRKRTSTLSHLVFNLSLAYLLMRFSTSALRGELILIPPACGSNTHCLLVFFFFIDTYGA